MAVLCPNLEQDVALDLLFYTGFDLEHEDLFLCLIFTQRLMNEQKIEPSDKRCLGHWVSNKFWLIPSNFHLHEKKSGLSWQEIYKALKTFLPSS